MKKLIFYLSFWILAISSISCSGGKNRTDSQWTTDMAKQNHVKAQEGSDTGKLLMKQPPKGTQARNRRYYPYTRDPLKASEKLKNPLPVTTEILKQGQTHYESYCIYCHGTGGDAGEGATVAPKMVIKPASLLTDKAKAYTDGRIYHIIYEGQGLMGAYQMQLETNEQALLSHSKNFNREYKGSNSIWALVHYVRSLQKPDFKNKKQKSPPKDLKKAPDQKSQVLLKVKTLFYSSLSDKSVKTSYDSLSDKSIKASYDSLSDKSVKTSYDSLSDKSIKTSYDFLSDKSIKTSYDFLSDKSVKTSYDSLSYKSVKTLDKIKQKEIS